MDSGSLGMAYLRLKTGVLHHSSKLENTNDMHCFKRQQILQCEIRERILNDCLAILETDQRHDEMGMGRTGATCIRSVETIYPHEVRGVFQQGTENRGVSSTPAWWVMVLHQ